MFAIAAGSFRVTGDRLREQAAKLTKDLQAVYFQAVQKSQVYRVAFEPGSARYQIQVLDLENTPPPEDDDEAFRAWEDQQEQRERELQELSPEERRALTRVDRAEFRALRDRELEEPVIIAEMKKAGSSPSGTVVESDLGPEQYYILFYPTGETEFVLLVLEGSAGERFSLVTNPLTGRVKAVSGSLEEEQWLQFWTTEVQENL